MRKPNDVPLAEIHGDVIALECFVTALCRSLSPKARDVLRKELQRTAEVARTLLLNSGVPDEVIEAFERTVAREADALNQGAAPATVVKVRVLSEKVIRSNDQS